jgi:hypothetical protein
MVRREPSLARTGKRARLERRALKVSDGATPPTHSVRVGLDSRIEQHGAIAGPKPPDQTELLEQLERGVDGG